MDDVRARRHPAVVVSAAVAALVGVLVVVLAGLWVADCVIVSRREAAISERIRPETPGVAAPMVTLGAAPFAALGGTREEFSSLTARVEGVPREGLGPVTVTATAHDVRLPADPSAPLGGDGAAVAVLLTAESLGRALGLEEAVVGHADDSSLAGSAETRARVSGRLPGHGAAVSALVDLVPAPGGARLVPVAADTGPAGVSDQDEAAALAHTALRLDPHVLPLGAEVTSLTVRAGTITASGHADVRTLRPGDLAAGGRGVGPRGPGH